MAIDMFYKYLNITILFSCNSAQGPNQHNYVLRISSDQYWGPIIAVVRINQGGWKVWHHKLDFITEDLLDSS